MVTSGPGMTKKPSIDEWHAWKYIFFLLLYKDKRMCSSNILLHRENEQRLTLFAGTQCTCNMKSSKGNQTHSTSIFMSCLHLHDLNTTLSASCTLFQTNRQRTKTVCVMVNCSPRPTCPNLDSADLYQAALVNMPWGMKLPNICDCFVWLCDCSLCEDEQEEHCQSPKNDLQQAAGVHVSDPTVRNRLHEGSMRAWCPLVGPVLTAQHSAAQLAFRKHQNWQVGTPFSSQMIVGSHRAQGTGMKESREPQWMCCWQTLSGETASLCSPLDDHTYL